MNREQMEADCAQQIRNTFEPLDIIIFNEITVNDSTAGWTSEMLDASVKAHKEFRAFLTECVDRQGMSGTPAKTFYRLWLNGFHDRLWTCRRRVAHHAFLNKEVASTILNLSQRIIGAVGKDHKIREKELIQRLYLIDWFHSTRTGKTLTTMTWHVGCDEMGDLVLQSPEWEVLKAHYQNTILTSKAGPSSPNLIYIPGSLAECKKFLDESLAGAGKDALDIILIKTKEGPAPWKPTFPVKAHQQGYKSDFNRLNLEQFAVWFPQSKKYDPGSDIPDKIRSMLGQA